LFGVISLTTGPYRSFRSFRRFNFGLLWWLILGFNRPVEKRSIRWRACVPMLAVTDTFRPVMLTSA